MKEFYLLIKNIGISGIWMFIKLKANLVNKLSIPGVKHPVQLRKGTTDVPTFGQIFIHREYHVDLEVDAVSIIDAGANVGLAGVFFANEFPSAKIISIEPEQSNFDLLVKNTSLYPNIHLVQKALSNTSDSLNMINNGYGNWGFMTEKIEDGKNNSEIEIIEAITIPEIMVQHNFKTLSIVKIDIEGFEKELFESNYEEWLPKTKCLIIELHDRMKMGCSKSFFKAISQYDFSFKMKGENLFFINNDLK
ncbi:MAG: FkbM family methyltransferase [Lentimonas sp.]|jgi:FkbM family methyltransferase